MLKRWTNQIEKLISHFGWQKYFEKDKKMLDTMECLYARDNKTKMLHRFYYERIAIFCLTLIVVTAAGIVCFLSKPSGNLKENYYLERAAEAAEVPLIVSMKGKDGGTNIQTKKEMKIRLPPERFTEKEKKELRLQIKDYLNRVLPGKNQGLDRVGKKLFFPSSVQGTDIGIEWSADETYITKDGRLKKKKISGDGVDTTVSARIAYRNFEETYSFNLRLIPDEQTPEAKMKDIVRDEITEEIKKQSEDSVVKLPAQAGQTEIFYQDPMGKKDYTPFFAACLIPILCPFLWREQQKKKLIKRERELLLDHPGFINQVMLLLSAGLTVRKAVERLVSEYINHREKGKPFRYLYEELWVACNQMKNGISEKSAIEMFGKRCKIMPYMRFSSIVTQNIKKGSYGLIPLLEADAAESFQRRKETVKKLGEEAGTKMLLPMMLMLALVMGILMIPAFMTM